MRFIYMFFGVSILLLGNMVWGQENSGSAAAARLRLRQMQKQRQPPPQQNPADFAPDPPPVQAQPAPPPTPAPKPPAAASATPAPIMPPEQLPPATPPQVTYRDGLLTVVATNSSLSSLLTAIRNKAGIQFEGLENGIPERIAIAMGPAPEGEVLLAILGGSGFDYVIVERSDSPGIVQRVLLSPRGGASASANSGKPASNPVGEGDDDEDAADEAIAPQDTAARPPLAQAPPPQPPQTQQQQPRSAEQMLEEIKRSQQQQQGQAQTQNAPQKTPQDTAVPPQL